MSEARLQFRVGLFVIVAGILGVVLIVRFGEMETVWEPHYPITIEFTDAPGLMPGTPVRMNGLRIGVVRGLRLSEETGTDEAAYVEVEVHIKQKYRLRSDVRPQIATSILGDAHIEIVGGKSRTFLEPDAVIEGYVPTPPFEMVADLERKVSRTLESFEQTSRSWQKVADNVNGVMHTHRGQIDEILETTAESLHQFSQTMKHANAVLGDPQAQDDLKQAIAAVSGLAAETRTLMTAMRSAIEKADANLENLKSVTGPLARRSNSIVTKLDGSIGHLEQLLAELNGLARMLNSEEGTFRKFVEDPELYRNLNRSAEALAILLRNLGPIMDDLAVLSDKLARHPELLGISGAVSPSTGIKTPGELDRVTPAGGVRRGGATSKARLAD